MPEMGIDRTGDSRHDKGQAELNRLLPHRCRFCLKDTSYLPTCSLDSGSSIPPEPLMPSSFRDPFSLYSYGNPLLAASRPSPIALTVKDPTS
jgi:hypothetical protein